MLVERGPGATPAPAFTDHLPPEGALRQSRLRVCFPRRRALGVRSSKEALRHVCHVLFLRPLRTARKRHNHPTTEASARNSLRQLERFFDPRNRDGLEGFPPRPRPKPIAIRCTPKPKSVQARRPSLLSLQNGAGGHDIAAPDLDDRSQATESARKALSCASTTEMFFDKTAPLSRA